MVVGPLAHELGEIGDGKRQFPTTTARRHHFVPAFLLARFAKPATRKGFLFQLDVTSGRPQRTTPDSTAYEDYLYATGADDDRELAMEAFFSVVEKHGAAAVDRLLKDPIALTGEDRQTLCVFFAYQYQRTPVSIDHTVATQQAVMEMLMGMRLADPLPFRDMFREKIRPEATDEEIEAFRQRLVGSLQRGEMSYADPKGQAFRLMLSTADDLASVINDMGWTLLTARDGEFVTSDRALAQYVPHFRFPWSGHAWLATPDTETTCALSPQHCLVFRPGPSSIATAEADKRLVDEVNLRTYAWAAHYVYGRTQHVVTEVRRDAKARPGIAQAPRPWRQVICWQADPDDPEVGRDNVRRGWPRGVWHREPGKEPEFLAYQVIDPDDRSMVQAAVRGGQVGREVIASAFERGEAPGREAVVEEARSQTPEAVRRRPPPKPRPRRRRKRG